MHLNLLSVLTSVLVSLVLSADDNSCMAPAADTSAIFNQNSASNATASIFEWTGETSETCNAKCCQSEECTVAVFQTAQQQADSRCQLYACGPPKSCTLRLGDGVAIFTRKVDSATTLRADVTSYSVTTPVSTDGATLVAGTTAMHDVTTMPPPDTTPSNGETPTPIFDRTTSRINSTTPYWGAATNNFGATSATTTYSLEGTSSQPIQSANSTTPVSTSASIDALATKAVQDSNAATSLPTASINSNPRTQGEQQSFSPQFQNVSLTTLTLVRTMVTSTQSPVETNVTPTLQPLQVLTNDTESKGTTATATNFSASQSTDPNSFVSLSTTDVKVTTTPDAKSAAPGSSSNAVVNQTQPPSPASSNDGTLPDVLQDTQASAETTPAGLSTDVLQDTQASAETTPAGLSTDVQSNTPEAVHVEAVHVEAVDTTVALKNSTSTANSTALTLNNENSLETARLPEGNATQKAHPLSIGDNLTLSKSKEIASNSSLTVPDFRQVNDIHQPMVVILVCALSFGCVFLLVVVGVLGRRIYEGYQKRHYSRLDYLINGMYS